MDNTDRKRFKSIQDVERYKLMTKEYRVEVNGKVHVNTHKLDYTFKFDNFQETFWLLFL